MIKNNIMETVFDTLFNMDSEKFIKKLEDHANSDVSYILNSLNIDFKIGINKTQDQNMSDPVEVTVKLIKQRKPEYINMLCRGYFNDHF